MSTIVLDYIDDIRFDPEAFPVANLHALEFLPRGLHLLADSVRHQEIKVIQQPHSRHLVLWTSPPHAELVTNWFGWFSISLISYLRLVRVIGLAVERGWSTQDLRIANNAKLMRDACREYILRVAPAVYRWRNKVGAHPAFTDPFLSDTLGTLELSVMIPVSYRAPYYYAGTIQWTSGGEMSALDEWALTPTFELMVPRFWPHVTLSPIPEAPSGGP